MRYILNTSLLLLILLSSCAKRQDNLIIYKEFTNSEWQRFEYLEGDIEITKTPAKYDLVMEIVVSDKYPSDYVHQQKDGSFLFNMTIYNSDGIYRSKDYRFALKDKDGFWNAEKKDGYYTFQLPVINEMTFTDKSKYKFKIENKYPKDPLYGIKSLELRFTN